MKSVAIFRFSRTEGPGYFATFLDQRGIPWKLFKLDDGEVVPGEIARFSGFVFMGGPMSANDDLPWIPPILELIRRAEQNGQPCLGHCLGGQLMSRALGGAVTANPVKEIGWHKVQIDNNPIAREWLNGGGEFMTFQWHGETFAIPPGATRILSSTYCKNQAYVSGQHLGMQCHMEMTQEMIEAWCKDGAGEIETEISQHRSMAVQDAEQIKAMAAKNLPGLNAMAGRLYERWLRGLKS